MLELRTVLFLLGMLLCLLATMMLIPMGLDYYYYDALNWREFCIAAFICGFLGALLFIGNNPHQRIELGVREAFVLTALLWGVSSCVAGLPFYFSPLDISFVDAFFEATSGLTTTGVTVFTGLDSMPHSLLLWRSMIQWFGGIGIIVMAMSIFPILRIGGMQLFRNEFSDRSEKILPRVSQIASGIFTVYTILTLLCFFCLYWAGMGGFDALCHAMGALSTGGFSTHDASIQVYHSGMIEFILIIFMILGGGTLILYVRLWQKDIESLFKDAQYRFYLLTILIATGILTVWYVLNNESVSLITAFRRSVFSVVASLTTTCFYVSDYTLWGGSFAGMLLLILGLIGGCTGSTSGGIKIFRIQVLLSFASAYFSQLRRVHGVYIPTFKGQKIQESIAISVFIYIALYITCILGLALILSLYELDFTTAFTGAVAAFSNAGVGLGQIIGPSGCFSTLESGAKLWLMVGMVLGRLELLTVLILFTPNFWKN